MGDVFAMFSELCHDGKSYIYDKVRARQCNYRRWLFARNLRFETLLELYFMYLSRLLGKPTMWFPNRSDTNRPVQSQKRARSLKFRI